jgi:hypothetical protein
MFYGYYKKLILGISMYKGGEISWGARYPRGAQRGGGISYVISVYV